MKEINKEEILKCSDRIRNIVNDLNNLYDIENSYINNIICNINNIEEILE